MALTVRTDGTAVVEEPKGTTAAAGAVADSGETVKDTTTTTTKTTKTEVPEAATAGMDFKTVQQNLNTTYDSKYDDQLADLYNQITQRKPFTYSTDDDMLYQEYLRKYTQQGKQAMKDTMGQTAALTGGYGNSYGQVAGQQTYDAYLQELNNLLPELQDAAYQKYAAEGDRLTQQYGLLSDMDDKAFSRYSANYQMNADAYNRLMNEAALLGTAGDFDMYKDAFGDDAAKKMEDMYKLQSLLPYFEAGLIDRAALDTALVPYLNSLGVSAPIMGSTAAAVAGDPWDYGGAGWNPTNSGYYVAESPSGAQYAYTTLAEAEAAQKSWEEQKKTDMHGIWG